MIPRCETKTWTLSDIERAVEAVRRAHCCPQCPSLLDGEASARAADVAVVGPWTLSVGRSDVIVTAQARCLTHGHEFIVRADLWRRAQTPIKGLRIKNKLVPKVPTRPRPLQHI